MATKVLIKTAKGDMIAELYDETPITTGNFIKPFMKLTRKEKRNYQTNK